LQFHINSSDDYPRCKYRDLVQYAKECAQYGVTAIQLTGWNLGGQDGAGPSHDVDPRLGTVEDLKYAIEECRKLGVRIILFTKFTYADESQPWFKNELIKYAVKDPYGNYYKSPGALYQTAVQLANINARTRIPMCPLSSGWRDIADNEFKKVLELGADGMLYDECQHHSPSFYCFDPNHGHHVPANVFSGDILLENGFREIARKVNPDFLFSGEACRDLQLGSYSLSYFRADRNHTPMYRYIASVTDMMIAIIGYNDRNPINQALMYKYILSYEPRHFKGHLNEFPLTLEYGRKVDAIREKYSDFLWTGEFMGTNGAKIKSGDSENALYSVFLNQKTGKRAVVVSNPSYNKEVSVDAELENGTRNFLATTPENPAPQKSNGKVKIPALSAVVLIEE
jgi:hypothetical protein